MTLELRLIDRLQTLLNVIGDDVNPILLDSDGEIISGSQAALDFWTDNLAEAESIDAEGFAVEQAAYEVAEGSTFEDALGAIAEWLAFFL